MTASAVSICSNALLMLGDNPINSFEDTGDRARLASNLWAPAMDYVLRSHPWNCAVQQVVLSPDADAPPFGFAYKFTLPGDWLRTLCVGEPGERPDFKIRAGKLHMHSNVCKLEYIFRNDNPATWDASLVWAMTTAMRAIFAYGISQSSSLEQVIDQALREVLRRARAADGQEETNEALDDNPLRDARFIGWSR